ncbi:MAG: tetratricopeptide repeat protein, partial [Longimicrobiales bacterium]|nr:tetratricopeptide repeat protein [Longimicrobiales bacterium]
MPRESSRSRRSSSYVFKFVGTASLLVLGTLVLVLYVLPERYVLSSGFREGNLNLPNPRTPFEPAPPLRIAAIPGIPVQRGDAPAAVPGAPGAQDPGPTQGPAELFWERVLPLLEAGRYRQAIPLFTDYLNRHPGDIGVRREYAITLAAAGYPDRAVPILRELLQYEDDDELHFLLARTLRDAGRVPEASRHYEILRDRRPGDGPLALEWSQALSWSGDYASAGEVVARALEASPQSLALRAEQVRIVYLSGRLVEADGLLASFSQDELERAGLVELRDRIRRELTPPPDTTTPPPPPTLLEQALQAREADDLDAAEALFLAALEAEPDDVDAWRAYADFLQYERDDFQGALEALREVERRTDGVDPALQYRMAQLEIWTDQPDAARTRLEALLASLEAGSPGAPGRQPGQIAPGAATPGASGPLPARADVLSLLGDLHRWNGQRLPAVRRYQAALAEDSGHEGAADGLDILRAEVDRFLIESEDPGIGAVASTFADTDDFRRYQAGGAWAGLHDAWVWSTLSGGRWVEGYEPGGGLADRQGLFAELEGGRWWRWGTVRTALHLGVQNVRSNSTPDVGVGASLRLMGASGSRTDLRFDHEPAHAVTNTLQS